MRSREVVFTRLVDACWAVIRARELRGPEYERAVAEFHDALSPETVLDLVCSARRLDGWTRLLDQFELRGSICRRLAALLREAIRRLTFDRQACEAQWAHQRETIRSVQYALFEAFGVHWGDFTLSELVRRLAKERDEALARVQTLNAEIAALHVGGDA